MNFIFNSRYLTERKNNERLRVLNMERKNYGNAGEGQILHGNDMEKFGTLDIHLAVRKRSLPRYGIDDDHRRPDREENI